MALGHAFEFDAAVEDVARSAAFYESLGFTRVERRNAPPATRLSDGLIVLALRPGREGTGLTYYSDVPDIPTDRATDPTGLRISVVRGERADSPRLEGRALSTLGQFGELSLETRDVGATAAFWRALGFAPTQYSPGSGAGWESLSDGLLMVGIYGTGHTKHVFKSPVITYFNDDAPQRIYRMKGQGFRFVQEIGGADAPREAVIEAPDGQMLFLFGAG
jgi:predicted enzyme related to lactoylglutathione lyase